MARRAKSNPSTPKPPSAFPLAVKAWRKSGHKQERAIKLLVAAIIAHPNVFRSVIHQHASNLITVVQGRSRKANLEPETEQEVKDYLLPRTVTKSPLLSSLKRVGTLVERDILDYHLQYLNKTLGEATPNEVESVTLARGEAEANKSLKIFACFRAIINQVPDKDKPIRKQISSAAVKTIAKNLGVYKDLVV